MGLKQRLLLRNCWSGLILLNELCCEKVVGWMCYAEDSWEDRGRRMSARLASCLNLHPLKNWSALINERKAKMIECRNELPYWNRLVLKWDPFECTNFNHNSPYRVRGHPHQRWDDNI